MAWQLNISMQGSPTWTGMCTPKFFIWSSPGR